LADTFGNTSIALPSAGTAQSITTSTADPFLDYLLSYLKTVANARLTTAWAGLVPGSTPVKTACDWEPTPNTLNERDLPALFAWRQSWPAFQRRADEWWLAQSQVNLIWVLPPAVQVQRRGREPFFADLLKLVHIALETGRDPSWRVTGDADANATLMGSAFFKYAKVFSLGILSAQKATLTLTTDDQEAMPRNYPAFTFVLDLWEYAVIDPARTDVFDGTDVTFKNDGITLGQLALDK
jgi:hypothetical protein